MMPIPLYESEDLLRSIARLKTEQKDQRASRKKLNKDLRNAEKRRSRLKKRARQLSDGDLVAVLQMRGSVTAPASSSGSASAVASTEATSDGEEPSRDR